MKKLGVFLLFFNSIIYSAWYTGWFYRKVITNSFAAGGDLTNFPLLVVISNDTALQSYASNNGYDILFTLKDGTTKLAHEMEYYSNGTIIAWIKIPILSAIEQDSNIIYMYYNTSSSSDQQNKNDVWSENYAGVWHLAETSGDASDSTVNARTAVNKFATEGNGIYPDGTLDTAALIGSGGHFITNDRLETASFDLDLPMTISAWMMADGTAAYWTSYPGSKAFGGFSRCGQSDAASIWKVSDSSMQTRMTILTTNGSGPIITNTALGKNNQAFSTNQWVYVTMTSDHTQTRAHLNGRNYFTTNHLYSDLMYKSFSWNIGMGRYSLPTFSYIDECRLSSVARSTNWLFTEYTNQIDPVSFRTLGAAETFSGVSFSSITPYSSPCLANENTVFTLNACVITGTIASVNISWGDGQSSAYTPGIANISTENYSHEYTARNNFSVTAVVTASSGMAATNSTVISTLPYRFYNPYNLS
ncbi:MAG TPA: hypothetical protein DC049_12400, partial [Spirochaetia bacterium]|nr:hypothetical protein [Spirochaetia bacterium]